MRLLVKIYFVALVAFGAPSFAQNAILAEAPIPAKDSTPPVLKTEAPPSRVGRLSLVSGNTSLRAPGETGWADAEMNQPVFAGQAVRTEPRSRAEIKIGATTINLSDSTELEIANLSDQFIQVAVLHGRIDLHLRKAGERESVEIDTPQGGLWLLEPGYYDIDLATQDQPSRIAVFTGTARFVGGGADTRIQGGNSAVFAGAGSATAMIGAATPDAFVEWCRARDYDETRLAAPYYVSPHMTGFDELDSAGSWKSTPEHGPVWVPDAVPADWAPYRNGHWSWTAPWGWMWIDDQPWGFAPSHYGRWALIDQKWVWVPGSFVLRPLFMPAAVAFLGTPGVGLSFAEGAAVGWFPLAPGEAYWPSYTRDVNYVRQLNLGNIEDVDTIRMQPDGEPPLEVFGGHFANRQFASVVPRPIFISGRSVASALVSLPEQRLRNAPVLMGSPQIARPSLQRVARASVSAVQPIRKSPATSHITVGISKSGDAKPIHTASVHPPGHGQTLILRGAHLRAPSYAGLSSARHLIVLRVAHAPHGAAGKGHRG